jgi:hypothetical protein
MDVAEFVSSDECIPSYLDDDLFNIDDTDDDESMDEWLERLHANVVC